MKHKLGMIGGGNMGEAIIANSSKDFQVIVSEKEPKRRAFLKRKYKVRPGDLKKIAGCPTIILAVKPQDISELLSEMKGRISSKPLIISIAAGITTKYIEKSLGGKARVIRAMPNMPAMIAEGITAICKGKHAGTNDLRMAKKVFDTLGTTVIVSENKMNSITATSGSGPAYVFLFIECLIKAAQSLGLKGEVAQDLVKSTFIGSLHLLQEKKLDPAVLRAKVTSKGGTTQAAMDVFFKNKIDKIIQQALKAANKRAKALSRR